MPYSITYLLQNMITMSGNVAATSLFYFSAAPRSPTSTR
jgi:hypothetical protein